MTTTITQATAQYQAALLAAEEADVLPSERAEMLMQIAMGLQHLPRSELEIKQALNLYERALVLCGEASPLLSARISARMGGAWQSIPGAGQESLYCAQACLEAALAGLKAYGEVEEIADAEVLLGLTLQTLAQFGQARIQDAIQAYHRALRVFTRDSHPQEYAVLHNNLAVAYLSIPAHDQQGKMREALAVQSFEEVLKVITLVDHPNEYAMAQNNLGNALQHASSGHRVDNLLRALEAYDEALKVRNPRTTPIEYANTLANKALALRSLPPGIWTEREQSFVASAPAFAISMMQPEHEDAGSLARLEALSATAGWPSAQATSDLSHLQAAHKLYHEAEQIFANHHETGKASLMREAIEAVTDELACFALVTN